MTITSAGADAPRLPGHDFARPTLLAEALTHPSALPAGRRGLAQKGRRRARRAGLPRHYERLEFLGDRVLGLVIADLLWRRFDAEPEGPLTSRHAQLVRRETLAAVAVEIGLDRMVQLSPAEAASGAARSPAILADVVEAVIAAIYLDGGFDAAFAFVERWWGAAPGRNGASAARSENVAAGMGAGAGLAFTRLSACWHERPGPRVAVHDRGARCRA